MSIKRVGGVAGVHRLDGPGIYGSCKVAAATTVGKIFISSGGLNFGSIAAGSAVGAQPAGATATTTQCSQADGISVNFTSGADFVDLDYAGPFG